MANNQSDARLQQSRLGNITDIALHLGNAGKANQMILVVNELEASMTPVVAYLNMKGGVGKTTLATNITRAMLEVRPSKMLLIDLDAQCNLSQLFLDGDGFDGTRNLRNVFECFVPTGHAGFVPGPSDIKVKICGTKAGRTIDLVYGSFEILRLQYRGSTLEKNIARQNFRRFIEQARIEYDLVVIDTNPGNPFAIECAMANSSFLVMPVTADVFSLRGIDLVLDVLAEPFPWVTDSSRSRIIVNKAKTTPTYLRRYNEFLSWLQTSHPTMMASLMNNKIRDTDFLLQAPGKKGFLLDQPVRHINMEQREPVVRDLTAAATELLIAIDKVSHPILPGPDSSMRVNEATSQADVMIELPQ